MDIRIISAFISAGVALLSFIVLQFFIEPWKQRRKLLEDRHNKLYAPLYGIVIARGKLGHFDKNQSVIRLAQTDEHFLNRETMEKLVYDNAGYASLELMTAWAKYTSAIGHFSSELTIEFVSIVLKDYHTIRKQLRIPYNKEELRTGIPDEYEYLRNKKEDPA